MKTMIRFTLAMVLLAFSSTSFASFNRIDCLETTPNQTPRLNRIYPIRTANYSEDGILTDFRFLYESRNGYGYPIEGYDAVVSMNVYPEKLRNFTSLTLTLVNGRNEYHFHGQYEVEGEVQSQDGKFLKIKCTLIE